MLWVVLVFAFVLGNALIWDVLARSRDSCAVQCVSSLVASGVVCLVILSTYATPAPVLGQPPPYRSLPGQIHH
jgi:hypothetical protein